MPLSSALTFASVAGLAAAIPMQKLFPREIATFPAGSSWDIVLDKTNVGNMKTAFDQSLQAIDIDLLDNLDNIKSLVTPTTKVICYFSAGTKETTRTDVGSLQGSDVGTELKDWPGEFWLNPQSKNVRDLMTKRMQQARDAGCSAVDPDNVDGYGNSDGFNLPKSAYVDYVKFLASTARSLNLAIGLKNAVELYEEDPSLVNEFQFAVNEQCKAQHECAKYKIFTDANKAVFNIEYRDDSDCSNDSGVSLSTVNKPSNQQLNTPGGQCPVSGGQASQPSSAAAPPATSVVGGKSTAVATSTGLPVKQTSTPTRGAPQPSPTGQGKGEDGEDGDDNDDNDDEPTPTRAAPRPSATKASGGGEEGQDGDDNDDVSNPTPTRAAPRPSATKSQGEGQDNDDNDDSENNDDENNDDDDEPTTTRALPSGGRPTGWGHGKGHKGQGWHPHGNLATSATPTPTA